MSDEAKLLQLTNPYAFENNGTFTLSAVEICRWLDTRGGGNIWDAPFREAEIFCPLDYEIVIRADNSDARHISVYRRRVE